MYIITYGAATPALTRQLSWNRRFRAE